VEAPQQKTTTKIRVHTSFRSKCHGLFLGPCDCKRIISRQRNNALAIFQSAIASSNFVKATSTPLYVFVLRLLSDRLKFHHIVVSGTVPNSSSARRST
jgi:hypothetical protein